MQKSIALFDIDNTLYQGFSYFALLAKNIEDQLLEAPVLHSAQASMEKYKTKSQDYETTIVELLDIYAQGLLGKDYRALEESAQAFYASSDKFFAYAKPVIALLRQTHDIALVTGEPQFVAEAVGQVLGVTNFFSTEYEVKNGRFTGKVKSYLASRHEKHDAIKHLMQGHSQKGSLAFGDSEGDIEMLRAADHAICLNATDGLRAIAHEHGWHTPALDQVESLVSQIVAS